jgi:hypothetical protein
MKKVSVLSALVLSSVALHSHAADFFVGAEAGVALFPDFTDRAVQTSPVQGSTATQDKTSAAFGIYGGAWLTENFGVEAAYTDLGKVEGSVSGTITSGPAAGTTVRSTYKYSANALSVTALGGIKLGAGTLYGKAGIYSATVKNETATGPGGSVTDSASTSSTGLVYGAGYAFPFTKHLVGKAEVAIYDGVQFQKLFAQKGTNVSENITKASLGLAYAF